MYEILNGVIMVLVAVILISCGYTVCTLWKNNCDINKLRKCIGVLIYITIAILIVMAFIMFFSLFGSIL